MPRLFGLDIAQIVSDSLASAGNLQQGTLTKTTAGGRDAADPTIQRLPTTTTHTFQGYVELREIRRPDTLIAETVPLMTIINASVTPAATAEVNDRASLGDVTYELVRLMNTDPAGATSVFQVR